MNKKGKGGERGGDDWGDPKKKEGESKRHEIHNKMGNISFLFISKRTLTQRTHALNANKEKFRIFYFLPLYFHRGARSLQRFSANRPRRSTAPRPPKAFQRLLFLLKLNY